MQSYTFTDANGNVVRFEEDGSHPAFSFLANGEVIRVEASAGGGGGGTDPALDGRVTAVEQGLFGLANNPVAFTPFATIVASSTFFDGFPGPASPLLLSLIPLDNPGSPHTVSLDVSAITTLADLIAALNAAPITGLPEGQPRSFAASNFQNRLRIASTMQPFVPSLAASSPDIYGYLGFYRDENIDEGTSQQGQGYKHTSSDIFDFPSGKLLSDLLAVLTDAAANARPTLIAPRYVYIADDEPANTQFARVQVLNTPENAGGFTVSEGFGDEFFGIGYFNGNVNLTAGWAAVPIGEKRQCTIVYTGDDGVTNLFASFFVRKVAFGGSEALTTSSNQVV